MVGKGHRFSLRCLLEQMALRGMTETEIADHLNIRAGKNELTALETALRTNVSMAPIVKEYGGELNPQTCPKSLNSLNQKLKVQILSLNEALWQGLLLATGEKTVAVLRTRMIGITPMPVQAAHGSVMTMIMMLNGLGTIKLIMAKCLGFKVLIVKV